MASALTVQDITLSGLAPSYVAADATGNYFTNQTGRTFLHVKNGGTAAIDVTVDSQQLCSFGFDHNNVVSVPAGGERMIGPFTTTRWNDANGRVNVSYSGVTSVTIAVLQIP